MKKIRFPKIKFSKKWSVPALGILVLLVVLGFSSPGKAFFRGVSVYFENVSKSEVSSRNFWLPSGRETYQIVQAAGADPKIHEATIDPPDVHLGDTQTLSIIVSSDSGIESVVAKIETDNGIIELPLKFVKKVSSSELQPVKYAVNEKSELVVLPEQNPNSLALPTTNYLLPTKTASAHAPDDWDKLLYEASWKVRDTHDAKYYTTFVVRNIKGEENSITLAWSDACAIPLSGSWNLATSYGTNCTISTSDDGVEIGTATIQTYTLTLNKKFAFNPGYSVVISSGAIAIGTGGELKQTYVWMIDADADAWPGSSTQYAQDSAPTNGRRRSALSTYTIDCSDADSLVWQWLEGYYDNDGDGYKGTGPVSVCSGSSLPSTHSATNDDCNDSNSYIYQTISPAFYDGDHDGWATDNGSSQCLGDWIEGTGLCVNTECSSSCPWDGYMDSTGVKSAWKNTSSGIDCNDLDADGRQTYGNLLWDGDADSYTTGVAQSVCTYAHADGIHYGGWNSDFSCSGWIANGYQLGDDCNDSNSNIFQIGGGGTDRNHDGLIQESTSQSNICVGAANPDPWYNDGDGLSCWIRGSAIAGYNQPSTTDGGGLCRDF